MTLTRLFGSVLVGMLMAQRAAALAGEATVVRLPNGLEAVLIENHGSPMIASTMIVQAGADWETASTAGSSHMLEHLLFNGTQRRTQKELYDEVDYYGIYNNATTRRSHTDYFMLVSSEHIREALDIQHDMLFHSVLPQEKFEKERGIVMEEIGKDELDPSYLADRLFRAAVFAGTPYGRAILGSKESILALSRRDVLAYYHATYMPSNMILLLVGDFQTDAMLSLVQETFDRPRGGALAEATGPKPPPLRRGSGLTVFHGASDRGYLNLAFEAPPHGNADSGLFALLSELLSERLEHDLILAGEPVLFSVGVSYERRETFGRLLVSCSFDPAKNPHDVERAIVESVDRFARDGVREDELGRFQISRKTEEIYLSEKLHYYGLMKAGDYARGGYDALEARLALLEELKTDQIARAAQKSLDTERRLAVALLPGARDYSGEDLTIHVEGEKNAWEEGPRPFFGMRDLTILRRAKGTKRAPSAAPGQRIDTTLTNALRLIVDSNEDSRVFAVHLLARHRSWQEPEGRSGTADYLHRLLLRGTEDRDAGEYQAALDRIGAEVKVCDAPYIPYDDYYTTPSFSFIRFTTIDEYAGAGLDLFAELLLRPRLDPGDVQRVREEKISIARGRLARPSDLSRIVLARALYAGHPMARDPEGDPESIGRPTREDLVRFHSLYFAPDNLILSVVTSLPADSVAQLIAKKLADLPRFTRRKPPPPDPAPTTTDTLVEAALGATQSYVRFGYIIPVARDDRAALRVTLQLLSAAMAFDLRETRGLAYSLGAGVSFHGDQATISAYMGTGPDNLDEAARRIKEHFDRYSELDDSHSLEVEKTVNALVGRDLMRRLSRPNQAYRQGVEALSGNESHRVDDLRRVTAADVIRAARMYIRSAPAVTVLVR